MAIPIEVTVTSVVPAPTDAVWNVVACLDGVNREFGRLLRMTGPRSVRFDDARVPRGRRWIRSWLLLFGVLPVEYDDLVFVRVDPGRGFLERSSMLTVRVWEHERTLAAVGDWTIVRDRVRLEPRLPVPARIPAGLVRRLFARRHRRLHSSFAATIYPE